jgi:uncharacterized protein YggL (DUF469 family)
MPDNLVTVVDVEGVSDGREMIQGSLQDQLGFQVRIRATDQQTAWTKANSIRTFMSEVVNQNKLVLKDGKTFIIWTLSRIGRVIDLTRDMANTERRRMTINATVSMKEI